MKPWSFLLGVLVSVSLVCSISCVTKETPVSENYSETKYEIEYKTETYTDTGDIVISTTEGKAYPSPVAKWEAPLYFSGQGSGTGMKYYGYEIDTSKHTRSQVKITLAKAADGYIEVVDLTGLGQIPKMPTTVSRWREEDPKTGDLWLNPEEQAWLDKLEAIDPARTIASQSMKDLAGQEIRFNATNVKTFGIFANTWNAHAITSVELSWFDDVVEKGPVAKERQVPYQVPYEVETQRTVMQKYSVPFWETMFDGKTLSSAPISPATPTEPTPAAPAAAETETNAPTFSLAYKDDFSNIDSGWSQVSGDWGSCGYEDGEYSISVEKNNWFRYQLRSLDQLDDFAVEVEVQKLSQGIGDAAGIVFRVHKEQDNDGFYVFWIDNSRGAYAVQKYDNGLAPELKGITESPYINENALNRLKGVCIGSQIEVYVNDHKLTTVTDTSFSSGSVGLVVESGDRYPAHFHFDNFKVYTRD